MSTRANVTAKLSNGKWKAVYVHHDGYPSHCGDILLRAYSTQEKVDALMAHGDMTSIDVSPECPPGHSYERPKDGFCTYYGRDRGEEGTVKPERDTQEEAYATVGGQAYDYAWDGQAWTVDGEPLTPERVEADQ